MACTEEGMLFFSCFELLLVLMYGYYVLAITSSRGTMALYALVGYTVLGSAIMAVCLALQWVSCGSTTLTYCMSSVLHT